MRIIKSKTAADVVEVLAEKIYLLSENYIDDHGSFWLAVSGGSTPKMLFSHLASKYQKSLQWKNIHIFWVDERCVPPGDAESNFGMTKTSLLDHVDIPGVNIHRILGENDPVKEAVRYAGELRQVPVLNALPRFDLILLGMGSDGHTASIFPDQMALMTAHQPTAVAIHPQTCQQRVTLTGPVINNARHVFFLITGTDKAGVVEDIVHKHSRAANLPASHIKPQGEAEWYLDEEAGRFV